MSIYPTLCDLAGIAKPAHVTGQYIRALLADPQAEWTTHALTTLGQNNHAVCTGRWRSIRYADGGEELYDHSSDDYEWMNPAVPYRPTGHGRDEVHRCAGARAAVSGAASVPVAFGAGEKLSILDFSDTLHLNGLFAPTPLVIIFFTHLP